MANVDIFYLSQRAAIEQQIERLGRRYGKLLESMASWNSDELAPHEVDDILTTAVELRLAIQKLQWFAKVNRDSSISLLDKLQSNKDLGPSSQEGLVKLPKGYSFGNPKDLLRQLELLDACIDSITALDTSRLSTSSLSFQLTFNYLFALNKSPPDRVTSKALYSAVDEDDVGRMSNLVVGQITNDKFSSRAKPKSVHLALLNLSVDLGAKKCIRKLIPKLERLHDPDSGMYETCLHRLILTMGRKRELIGRLNPSLPRFSRDPDESLLQFILDQLSPNQQQDVLSPDETGRTPLHYAAHYGLVDACAVLVERIQNWDLLKRMPALPDLKDSNGHSPLHSSVIQGWALVTSLLLAYPGVWSPSVSGADSSNSDTLGALLTIALHAEHEDVTRVLLKNRDINLNYRGKHGETAIFIAARSGSLPYIKMILESIPGWTANVDLVASGSGWTPLIAACVGDHREAAKVLLEAGADQNIRDSFGWTAKDHVAFRGHWKIAAMLTAPTLSSLSRIPKGVVRKTNALPPLLPDETRMFVNIGTLNSREPRESVDLRPLLSEKSLNPYPDTTFAIRIRATNASGKCDLISLPQINDKTNFPAVFTTRCPDKSNVVFDLYKDATNSQEDGLHIGSAVALLGSLKQGLGPSRGSFIRNYTIPILEKSSLKLIGTLTFDFLVVKPFPDPRTISIKPHEMIWPRSGSTHVIGHRGRHFTFMMKCEYADTSRLWSKQSCI
jgi:glycerophosphodiester phosphodiesterase